ncbi:MAG: class B sortase [Lachnospiraceae bacterium]|nr:class B sortase [Lachnospiraceae bacterium]
MIIQNQNDAKKKMVWKIVFIVSTVIFGLSILSMLVMVGIRAYEIISLKIQSDKLQEMKVVAEEEDDEPYYQWEIEAQKQGELAPKVEKVELLPEYENLYDENPDIIGWLTIDGTKIDYPVMQKKDDEDYYLSHDFYGKKNSNGTLILDDGCEAGVGIADNEYKMGLKPSTNLIIHGHTMKTGDMFGKLHLYKDEEYGKEHSIIRFDSLYEKREYELMCVFYSEVFAKDADVFKYYQFFEAASEEEFTTWYDNVKKQSLYPTGVLAEYGDEFLTLSACSYHKDEGRFVVVAKRIYPDNEE